MKVVGFNMEDVNDKITSQMEAKGFEVEFDSDRGGDWCQITSPRNNNLPKTITIKIELDWEDPIDEDEEDDES